MQPIDIVEQVKATSTRIHIKTAFPDSVDPALRGMGFEKIDDANPCSWRGPYLPSATGHTSRTSETISDLASALGIEGPTPERWHGYVDDGRVIRHLPVRGVATVLASTDRNRADLSRSRIPRSFPAALAPEKPSASLSAHCPITACRIQDPASGALILYPMNALAN